MKRIPGFVAERALTVKLDRRASVDEYRSEVPTRANNGARIVPMSRYCRRLLRECLAGSNPRSFACDSWLILC